MNPLNLTLEELQSRKYSAALDSVNLINGLLNKPYKSQEDIDSISRNIEHLKIVVEQDLGSADLIPIQDVIARTNQATLQVSVDPAPAPTPAPIAGHLPDRKSFHELASGSQLWNHISVHTPELSMLLYIALTASSELNHATVMQDVKNMMRGIVAQLGTDHALHSTQSLTMVNDPNDPEGLPISVGTLADELDTMLSESFFGFTYADLM
jgi:hypothetical protein